MELYRKRRVQEPGAFFPAMLLVLAILATAAIVFGIVSRDTILALAAAHVMVISLFMMAVLIRLGDIALELRYLRAELTERDERGR